MPFFRVKTRDIVSLLLLVSPLVASGFDGVVSYRDIEPARSLMMPYNSDSLLMGGVAEPSLYVSPIDEWQRSEECDTLFVAKYVFPFEWLNREVILRLDYVDAPYSVEVNGKSVASVTNGGSRTEFNITRQTEEGANILELRLSPNSKERAVEGWRESNKLGFEPIVGGAVLAPSKLSIRDIFTRTNRAGGGAMNSEIGVVLKSYNLNERVSVWRYRLRNSRGEVVANGKDTIKLRYRSEDTLYISTQLRREDAWSGGSDNGGLHELSIELRHDERIAEVHRLNLGLRSLEVDDDGKVWVNGDEVALRAMRIEERTSRNEIIRLRDSGVNTLLFSAGDEAKGLYEMLTICDEEGLFAIVTAPINSRRSGDEITVGGNVTNNREWLDEYRERLVRGYYNVRRHPSVVAYNMATKSLNGYNLYEGYLLMKGLDERFAIVNLDGGDEWNGDNIKFELVK
ncbi:MAG: glycoside hydrolase family 2 TIM barrel-domain containing protein [Rikenellaceae bacterium]